MAQASPLINQESAAGSLSSQLSVLFIEKRIRMSRIVEIVFVTLLLSAVAAPIWAQGTYTAATCNQSDVNAVINGPTHRAVDGDMINIPSGSCTWSTGVTVPSGIGITIRGSGSPNSTSATTGASSSCTATNLTISGPTAFRMTPIYGNSTSRLTCMKLTYGSGGSIAFSVLGSCSTSGCPNLRVDNITFTNWSGHGTNGISYGISAVGNMFGVLDHNTINGTGSTYLQLVELSHASYLGVGSYGDNSWHVPPNYGSANFLYFENNLFNASGTTENEGSAGALTDQGGGRVVVRYNTFANMDNYNFTMGWHGTESSGRPRSITFYEYYGNSYTCAAGCDTVVGTRGGTGLGWGNTINKTGVSLNNFFGLNTYRTQGSIGGWGVCDGSSVWDKNDGVTYFSGTVASGGGTQTITVSGSPGWTTNQWVPNGAPYSMHDVTKSTGSEITANTSNTLTVAYTGGPGAWLPNNGDSIQILRATACIDQGGGRGAGILYSGSSPSPSAPANEALSPAYFWTNTFIGGSPNYGVQGINSDTARIIRSRDFYVENINQTVQSNSSTPFNGTNTIGMGHGIYANMPTSCTTGVGYWATDRGNWNHSGNGGQGQLYVCTATNTWTLYYTPYTYPHPLIGVGTAPAAPTNLQAVSH